MANAITILNVEDCDDVRALVTEMLAGEHVEVVEAATGEDALHKAKLGPDLVILDV